ncbi:MAG TPA: hypothetical protein VH475_06850, partial [Tepidisphaeraceae bacterium]
MNRAVIRVVETLEQRVMLAGGTILLHEPAWNDQGPGTITGTVAGPNNTGSMIPATGSVGTNPATGAIQAVATLPNSADIVYVATVNGGIWRSLDATSADPTWTPLAQDRGSLAYGAIAISPFDNTGTAVAGQPVGTLAQRQTLANKLVIYAGHANFSSTSRQKFNAPRVGVEVSTDGGAHWNLPTGSFKALQGLDIYRIVPGTTAATKDLLLVAAGVGADPQANNTGVWLSTNRATTFTHVLGGDTSSKKVITAGDATDIIVDPANGNRFYAAITDINANFGAAVVRGVYTSTNAGSTWILANGPAASNNLNAAVGNGLDDDREKNADPDANEGLAGASIIKLAASSVGGTTAIYAALIMTPDANGDSRFMAIYRSTNAATNWLPLPNFGTAPNGSSVPDINSGGQAITNFSMVADPGNTNRVFVAGDDEPGSPVAGIIWRATIGAATPWEQVTDAGATSGGANTAPHPDSRNMVFDALGRILEVDDGGIYRLNSPGGAAANNRNWTSMNGSGSAGLHIGEFYSVARDPTKGVMFGGLQDIGVVEQPTNGATFNWQIQPSGDGGIAQIGGVGNAIHYSSGNGFKNFAERTYGGGATLTTTNPALGVVGSGPAGSLLALNSRGGTNSGTFFNAGSNKYSFDNALPFTTQFALDAVPPTTQAKNRILIGTQDLYESFDDGATLIPLNPLRDLTKNGVDEDGDGVGLGATVDPNEWAPRHTVGRVLAIAYGGFNGATPMPDIAYVGVNGRTLLARTSIATVGSPTFAEFLPRPAYSSAAVGGGDINDIVLNPTDWTNGFVVDQRGNVFRFVNQGLNAADWRRINGTGLGLSQVKSVEVVPSNNPNVKGGFMLVVAGMGGVYVCLDPAAAKPVWSQVGSGLPNAIVTDVRYDVTNKVLYCGTLGRGAWSIPNFPTSILPAALPAAPLGLAQGASTPLPAGAPTDPGSLEITGDLLANKNDTIRLALDAGNPNLLNIFVNNTTDAPDLAVPLRAVQRVFVTGGQGDDTLLIDDANGTFSFDGGITFDQSGPGTNVQQEINQTPIDGGIASKIRAGLQGLADLGAAIAKVGDMAKQIPGLGINLAQTFGIGDGSDPIGGAIKRGLLDPISNFFNTDVNPTVQELTSLLRTLSQPLGNISFGIDPFTVRGGVFDTSPGHQELRFDIDVNLAGFAGNLSLDFGDAVKSLGLTFDANGKVNLETALNLSFSFGVDLTPGLSDADAFFIDLRDLSASAHVGAGTIPPDSDPDAKDSPVAGEEDDEGEEEGEEEDEGADSENSSGPGLNFSLNAGFLQAQIVDGAFELDADAHVILNNPDNDPAGHVTLAELRGTSLDSLLDFELDGDFKAHLPVQVSLAGLTAINPTIDIDSEHLFDEAPDVKVSNFDNLLDFNSVTPLSILGLLKQVNAFLERFKGSAALSTKIPFTSKTVGDVLDLEKAFTDKLYSFLEPSPGQAAFDSAQKLASLLADKLGLSPDAIGAKYDATTKDLTFHVKLSDSFAPQPLPVDLGLQLGSLAGLSTSSTIGVSASAGLEFTFGVNLSAPAAGITGSVDAPTNGRLSAPAHFSVQVGSDDPVDVTVPADATNSTIDDLVADINTALTAAGLGDTVKAGRNGNKITFSTSGLLTPASLTISTSAGDPAQTQLGFSDTQTASDTLGKRFFIKDASVTGSANLSATDIDALAHLGFLSVGVVNGTGGVTASFNASLVDPGTDAADGKISLSELFNALSGDVSTLAPTPTLTGSANLTLPLRVDPNILGADHPANPTATVTWTDIRDPGTLSVNFNADTSKLLDFKNISFTDVIQAILKAVQYVSSLEKFSFLNQKLPLLNKSVSELVGAADQLLQKVNAAAAASPADSLQNLENVLEQALGLPSNALGITLDGKNVKVALNFNAGGTQTLPMDFDLASLAANVPGLAGASHLIDVQGAGSLTVGANAALNLNIGVDLTNPTSPRPFLYDNSAIDLTANASGNNLNFTAAVGPLGLFVKGASVNLDKDGNPNTNDSATFHAGIFDDNGDGKHYFDELDTGDARMTLTGQAHATLPLFFPTSSQSIGNLSLAITDLSNISGTTTITTPDLHAQFNVADLLNNVGGMVDGLDFLLKTLQDGMDGQVFGRKLPLIGDHLKDGARFIEDIREKAIEPLRNSLQEKPPADALKQALFTALGPSGLGLLGDNDGNGTIDLNDIGVTLDPSGSQILFNTRLHKAATALDLPLGFDIGLPGLGLEVDGGVAAKIGYDFHLAFGLSKTDGFFFVTDTKDGTGASIPELKVDLDATTPGLSATGRLAILQLRATDSTTSPTHFGGSFSVDLTDPNGDGKLTAAELAANPPLSSIVKAKLTANADVNLHLDASFGGGADFPSIQSDFALHWAFANAPMDSPTQSFGGAPTVSFTNIKLDAGEFFSRFAKPILAQVQSILKPIQPIIDILTTPLPVLSDIKQARSLLDFDKDGKVSLLDLVHLFNPNSKLDFITSLAKTADLLDAIPTSLPNLDLDLGSFNIGSDLRTDTQLTESDLANVVQKNTQTQLNANPAAQNFLTKLNGLNSVPGAGLAFPILQNPSSVFKLMLGNDVNLFTYDMPTLAANFEISEFFPVLGPLGARFTGSIGATAHFGFGYDTTGLREYFNSPSAQRDVAMLLDGLFVSDRKNADGTGPEVPEVTLTGGIEADAELNLGIASAGVGGGIFADIGFDLDDPNNDGKMRFNEMFQQLQRGPMCLFDVHGELTAGLKAYISFLFSKKTFTIATVKLLDFNYSCPADPAEPDPILATATGGGVLRLNIGPNAAARQFGDHADGDEVYTISPGSTPDAISIQAFGFTQEYTGVTRIVGDGGAGNDNIIIKDGVNIPVSFTGGDGDDSLFASAADSTLDGGLGNDQLRGGAGNDCLTGGDGDDVVLGMAGNDRADGGTGDDDVEGGDGNDTLTGGTGQDVLSGGAGDDNLDGGDDADDLSGGDGTDILTGGLGDDNLDGEAGNDLLQGNDGNDHLTGGTGNDTALGGLGNDTFDGGSGDDQLSGDAGNDVIAGGTGNDTLTGSDGADTFTGDDGNDSILGGIGADNIDGGAGNDFIDAGDDNDAATGGAGSDTIFGGLGADVILAGVSEAGGGSSTDANLIFGDGPGTGAGGSADRIVGDIGPDVIHAGAGDDTVTAVAGDDSIDGDDGNDSISGGAGNDTIGGDAGNDTLFGQEGDDAISGDDGLDVIGGDAGNDLLWGGAAAFDRPTFLAGGFAADGITPLVLNGQTIDGTATDGRDSITGGTGGDWLFGGGDSDQLYGGADNDYADGGAGNDTVQGDSGNDVVRGGGNADLVHGAAGIDQVYGDDGDDTLYGDDGDAGGSTAGQRLFGGAGQDNLYAFAATTGAPEFALTGDEMHGGDDNDTLHGNIRKEKLFGDGGADLIIGDELAGPLYAPNVNAAKFGAADQIFGGMGEDQILGGGGNDTVFGGGDSDRLEGQDGADQLFGGGAIDVIVLDVDPTYTTGGDSFDGHLGNDAPGDVPDDNATDILLIQGTSGDDTITIGESAGQLRVTYNGKVIPATWRGAAGPLVEQFRVSGLAGNDRIEFLSGTGGLDVSALSARSTDFIGVADGGPGNDTLIGTAGRDRLDGGRGSDLIQGLGGDDRVFGDGGTGQGDPTDLDVLFGGQGNDDLIGGQGSNQLYAWSRDPAIGQFGVFVDPVTGALHDDDGGGQFVLEDTGMNRMLGSPKNDTLFGGTGLDFMYGNGGQDVLINRDGTTFDNLDGNLAGQQWKDYARSTGKVWYVGGSNANDVITVDFVTEPGFLQGHHLVTRLTNNNGNVTFAAQVQLDFEAKDAQGHLIWDPQDLVFDPTTLEYGDPTAFARLLPPESDFQAIIIDALDGNDQITVGPTVTKSVWIDAGAGDDRVTIKSGNPILPDQVEGTTRNDVRANAYNLFTDPRVGAIATNRLLQGMTIDSPTDVDFYRFRLAAAIQGNLVVTSLSSTDGMTLQVLNATTGAVIRTSVNGVLSLTGLTAGIDQILRVASNAVPTVYQLAFNTGATPVITTLAAQGQLLRRDIILGGEGDDVLSGGSGEDWILGGAGNDVLSGGLDRQASDLLFGEAGDDTFQLVPDALPTIPESDRTIIPTLTDSFDGGTGNDRVLFLGGDLDRNSKPVPDTVAVKFNTQLHRYELTSLVWDIANQRYQADATGQPTQLFSFYQAHNVERTVIDTRAGDDEIHADPGYLLGGQTYGIKAGDFQQNAQIAALEIHGGEGNDRIFGGAMGDVIDGGPGLDFISGGGGDDTITGGADNDVLQGNAGVPLDRFESVTRNGVSGRNDDPAFAALLPAVQAGTVIDNLTFHLGDSGDWYIIKTPDALLRLGTSQAAFLTSDLIDVRLGDGTAAKFFLFAARQADPTNPNSILPVERPTGVPAYYMLHVVNTDTSGPGGSPGEVPGTYKITFSSKLGQTVHVPPTQANFTLNSAQPADQPAIIPLGDINGDGFVDFIAAIQDYSGGLADYRNASNFPDYPGNSADLLNPSFARIYFGNASTSNVTLPTNAVTLRLPAPIAAPSYFGSQSIFANPADYNGDGIKDIAVAVTRSFRYNNIEAPFANEGVYIIFGKASGFTGTIDVVNSADVTIKGFAQPPINTSGDFRLTLAGGDVNGDGIDDLLVGNPAAGGSAQGAVNLFLGRTNWTAAANRQVFSADFSDTSGSPSLDGFTIDNTGVTTAGLWHLSTGRNTQANHSAGGDMYFGTGETVDGGGNYDGPNRAGRVTSPAISLAGLANATLNFKYFLGTEPLRQQLTGAPFDRARVMVSVNGGAFTPLQVRDGATLRDAGAANRFTVSGGDITQPGFMTDPTTGWTNATFDLSAYVGSSIRLQFDFLSNGALNAFEGWYVDDVTVTGAPISPASANATFTGATPNEMVGAGVAGIGDFNGDGKKDFAILRVGLDTNTPGEVYLFNGRGTADASFTSGVASNL